MNDKRWMGMQPYDPTPEEIAEGTARIREGWSPAERIRRAGFEAPDPVTVQVVETSAWPSSRTVNY